MLRGHLYHACSSLLRNSKSNKLTHQPFSAQCSVDIADPQPAVSQSLAHPWVLTNIKNMHSTKNAAQFPPPPNTKQRKIFPRNGPQSSHPFQHAATTLLLQANLPDRRVLLNMANLFPIRALSNAQIAWNRLAGHTR